MTNNTTPITVNIPSQFNFLIPTACDDLIRVGRPNDGGYIISQRIVAETQFLISLGIYDDWSFDSQLLSLKPTLKIHAYDYTISKKHFTKRLLSATSKLFFGGAAGIKEFKRRANVLSSYKVFFGTHATHYQERVHHQQENANDATVKTMIGRAQSNNIFIKMDIEGSEYAIIDNLLQHASQIIGFAIEFHETFKRSAEFSSAIQKMNQHYTILHVHANNFGGISANGTPETMEITFIRKDLCQKTDQRLNEYLEDLDQPCNPKKPDYALRFAL